MHHANPLVSQAETTDLKSRLPAANCRDSTASYPEGPAVPRDRSNCASIECFPIPIAIVITIARRMNPGRRYGANLAKGCLLCQTHRIARFSFRGFCSTARKKRPVFGQIPSSEGHPQGEVGISWVRGVKPLLHPWGNVGTGLSRDLPGSLSGSKNHGFSTRNPKAPSGSNLRHVDQAWRTRLSCSGRWGAKQLGTD